LMGERPKRSPTLAESRVRRASRRLVSMPAARDEGMSADRMQVLVPADQEVLMARFARALRAGSVQLAARDVTKSVSLGAPIESAEVFAMEVPPLPDAGSDAGSDDKQSPNSVNGALR